MKIQKAPNSQSNLKKGKQSWSKQAPWFQIILQSYSHQNSMILTQRQSCRSMEQDRKLRCRKNSLFSKWFWVNCRTTCKRMKLEHSLTSYTKINSKWIKYLNVRLETIKFLKENTEHSFDINCSNVFLDLPPTVMKIKTKINKWNLIKLKSFCTAKETINKVKRQPTEWEKIFANDAINFQNIQTAHAAQYKKNQPKNRQKI